MKTLDFGVPSAYGIRLSSSPVFECALDIAAFTREDIYEKLERSLNSLQELRDSMSTELRREVEMSGEVHTWRSLLFLAHRCSALSDRAWDEHLDLFIGWLEDNETSLRNLAAPYLGEVYVTKLEDALSGNIASQEELLEMHADNPVVNKNLLYLFSVEPLALLKHLKALLAGWYREVFPNVSEVMVALQHDIQDKKQLAKKVTTPELIRVITKGGELQPKPGVDSLWLIPQAAYRPFTIINHLPRCLVYYYPVSDEFLPGGIDEIKMTKVAGLHKALGDVQRIRLLNLLRHSPKSLAELTDSLKATKSNVHHHLTLLRTAGLVQVESGVYSINNNSVLHVGDELREFLRLSQDQFGE